MVINHWVVIKGDVITRDGVALPVTGMHTPEDIYRQLQCAYPKFFKMDKLCKWALVAGECLFEKNDKLYDQIDKYKVAVALSTAHGCIDVDKRYLETIAMPSPALFVYTLPNVMLGELCIRHGFKGEQLCMVSEQFDAAELHFSVAGFLQNSADACLCGWVDAAEYGHSVCFFWVTKNGPGLPFTPAILNELYKR